MNLQDIGVAERLVMFANGQEVVDYFDKLLNDIDLNSVSTVIQPVSLLILDINMPIKNGIDTMRAIREMFS